MSCKYTIIDHDNCAFDTNCGLTCDGIIERELANDPTFVMPPGFYEEFIENCYLFYWPNGCGGLSSSSDGGNSDYLISIIASNDILSQTLIVCVMLFSFFAGLSVGSK